MIISEYWNEGRKAVIRREREGFEVDLYKDDLKETRQVHEHSETYAENVAENFVHGIFDIEPEEKEGSFYGYREKSANYYPGDD